jgi:hypothetical protein
MCICHVYGPKKAVSSHVLCFHRWTCCRVLDVSRWHRSKVVRMERLKPNITHSTMHIISSCDPQTAISSDLAQFHWWKRNGVLRVSIWRYSNAVHVKHSKPNVTRSTTCIVSSYDPQMAVSSLNPCFHQRKHCCVLEGLRQHHRDAVCEKHSILNNVKCSNANVDPETNARGSFAQPEDPRVFTALKWLCSHHSERARPCQDGMAIWECSNVKRSKCSNAKRSRHSKMNVCRTMKQLLLSTEPPTSQLGSPTRDTHLQDACLAGVPHHALIWGRSERSDARQQTHVNIKYVTKVTCHTTIIKHVYTFATEFTGPVHLQGQVCIPNKVPQVILCFLPPFTPHYLQGQVISSLLAGSSGFFNWVPRVLLSLSPCTHRVSFLSFVTFTLGWIYWVTRVWLSYLVYFTLYSQGFFSFFLYLHPWVKLKGENVVIPTDPRGVMFVPIIFRQSRFL